MPLYVMKGVREKRDKHGSHGDGADVEAQGTSTSSILSPATVAPQAPPVVSHSAAAHFLQFTNIGNATTCHNMTFTWSYSGGATVPLTLSVSGGPPTANHAASSVNSSNTAPPKNLLRTLATNVSSDSHLYTWQSVDVKEGWYLIQAAAQSSGFSAQSASFFVQNGTNVTCLMHAPSANSRPMHRLSRGELVGISLGAIAGVAIVTVAFIFPRLWRRALPPKKGRSLVLY